MAFLRREPRCQQESTRNPKVRGGWERALKEKVRNVKINIIFSYPEFIYWRYYRGMFYKIFLAMNVLHNFVHLFCLGLFCFGLVFAFLSDYCGAGRGQGGNLATPISFPTVCDCFPATVVELRNCST